MMKGTLLSNRGILRVSGQDRKSFLQGLMSNDVKKLEHQKTIYALLLSPQGKFQYDLFITNVGEELWVDAARDRLETLQKRLQLFKLKADVALEIDLFWSILTFWGNNKADEQSKVDLGERFVFPSSHALGLDPRLESLGERILLPSSSLPLLQQEGEWEMVDEEEYYAHCLKLGVPSERDLLVDKAIPLECGMDELNAIDWDKGCYMGQELTARTRYRGLIRKRLIPCQYTGTLTAEIVCQVGQEVGEIRSFNHAWVMVLLRLEALEKAEPLVCGSATLTPRIPDWMKLPKVET